MVQDFRSSRESWNRGAAFLCALQRSGHATLRLICTRVLTPVLLLIGAATLTAQTTTHTIYVARMISSGHNHPTINIHEDGLLELCAELPQRLTPRAIRQRQMAGLKVNSYRDSNTLSMPVLQKKRPPECTSSRNHGLPRGLDFHRQSN